MNKVKETSTIYYFQIHTCLCVYDVYTCYHAGVPLLRPDDETNVF